MLNKKQSDEILYSLSSFYRDYLPTDNQLLKLYNIYAKLVDYVWTMLGEAQDSRAVFSTRTLSTLPYVKVNIDDAMYDMTMARVVARMSFDEQIAYLEKEQKYARFIFSLADNAGDPSVYAMRLFVNFGDEEPLRLYEDYFIRSNRLYLLPQYVQRKKKAVHYLHAFDVKINDYTLEKNFGTRFNVEAGPLLPRYEYRDVLEAYMRVFRGQMTIKSLKEGLELATKWEDFKLEDMKSPTISARKLKLYEDWVISPNKFLVSIPEILIPDKIKINIVRALMGEIKNADKDYMLFFDIDRLDPYVFPVNRYPTVRYNRGEQTSATDDFGLSTYTLSVIDYPLDVAGRYDTTFYYNLNLRYDDPPSNEIISLLQKPKTFEEDVNMQDDATITHLTSPRIPRHFTASLDDTTSDIFFSLSSNQDETTQFELHRAAEEFGPYELVEVMDNDPAAGTLTFQHSAKDSVKRYYKSRAVGTNTQSLFTLPTNVDAL